MEFDHDTRMRLVRQLTAEPTVSLAILFGSAARGGLRADSDLDVGFLPVDPELSLADELQLQARLTLIAGREVDLVRLDRASTILKWQVARHGQLLLARDRRDFTHFVAATAAEYIDFAPAFDFAERRFHRRLAEAGGGPE